VVNGIIRNRPVRPDLGMIPVPPDVGMIPGPLDLGMIPVPPDLGMILDAPSPLSRHLRRRPCEGPAKEMHDAFDRYLGGGRNHPGSRILRMCIIAMR